MEEKDIKEEFKKLVGTHMDSIIKQAEKDGLDKATAAKSAVNAAMIDMLAHTINKITEKKC